MTYLEVKTRLEINGKLNGREIKRIKEKVKSNYNF